MDESLRLRQSRLTEDIVSAAFLELLKEKPIEKITVADICRTAGVNRGTFYYHYRDIEDLKEHINKWYANAITPMILEGFRAPKSEAASLKTLKGIMEVLASWPEYSIIMLWDGKGQAAIQAAREMLETEYLKWVQQYMPGTDQRAAEYRFTSFFYAGWGILSKWTRDGCKESPEYIREFIKNI